MILLSQDCLSLFTRRYTLVPPLWVAFPNTLAFTSSSPQHIQIKKCICEVKGTNYYALVNQTEHPLNKLSPLYSPAQLELFKKIIEEVLLSDSGTVTSMQVLNFEFGEAGECHGSLASYNHVFTLSTCASFSVKNGVQAVC